MGRLSLLQTISRSSPIVFLNIGYMLHIRRSLWASASKLLSFLLCGVLLPCFWPSCVEKVEHTPTANDIRFSIDTVKFDSVFVAEVSPTRIVRIHNLSSRPIVLPRVRLQGAATSPFTLLIDGRATLEAEAQRIEARDSLTILARLRSESETFTSERLEDEIVISLRDGASRSIHLLASGLAHNDIEDNNLGLLEDFLQAGAETPVIIKRPLHVPKGKTLYIPAGASLFFRAEGALKVYGSLVIEGTPDARVLLAGTRLDTAYKHTPGQWLGVTLMPGSGPHRIKNATFRAAVTALRADSVKRLSTIENTVVTGSSKDAMVLKRSNLLLRGCLFVQNSGAALAMAGSRISLIHCSLSGATRFGQQRRSALISMEKPPQGTKNELSVVNTIVWGSYDTEFRSYDKSRFAAEIVTCSHSLLKWGGERPASSERWEGVIYNNPHWEDPLKHNLELKASSPARGSALALQDAHLSDLKGRTRLHPDGTVDMGALVWRKKE